MKTIELEGFSDEQLEEMESKHALLIGAIGAIRGALIGMADAFSTDFVQMAFVEFLFHQARAEFIDNNDREPDQHELREFWNKSVYELRDLYMNAAGLQDDG